MSRRRSRSSSGNGGRASIGAVWNARLSQENERMIIGAHVMIQSSNDQADKGFFRDVLKMPSVDAGGGFLLFGVPPTEIAVHGGSNGSHELYLMCDDVAKFISDMTARGLSATPAQNQGWGIVDRKSTRLNSSHRT